MRRPLDDVYFLQRFTPRGPRSRWSQVNREKAVALIDAGRMRPAGHAQVRRPRPTAAGRPPMRPRAAATVPDDLQRALDADPAAREFFATLTGSSRYAFLYRLHSVRTPEGRERRIADYIERLREGRTLR